MEPQGKTEDWSRIPIRKVWTTRGSKDRHKYWREVGSAVVHAAAPDPVGILGSKGQTVAPARAQNTDGSTGLSFPQRSTRPGQLIDPQLRQVVGTHQKPRQGRAN